MQCWPGEANLGSAYEASRSRTQPRWPVAHITRDNRLMVIEGDARFKQKFASASL